MKYKLEKNLTNWLIIKVLNDSFCVSYLDKEKVVKAEMYAQIVILCPIIIEIWDQRDRKEWGK